MLQMHLSGGGGTPWLQPKSNETFKLASTHFLKFLTADFGVEIFIIVATVPTGLQTCAKRLQMHLSGGGGTPWLQPKSNETFKLASTHFLKFLTADFGVEIFIIVATVPTGLQTSAKMVQMHLSKGGGTP